MIGIGITTYLRDEILNECITNIQKYTLCDYDLYIAKDSYEDRKGVAYRKNECLWNLQKHKHIFLFDDDCYPQKDGWHEYVIQMAEKTKNNHFCYNKEQFVPLKQSMIINGEIIDCYDASGGVFMYYSNEVIQKVGAFYTEYDLYGYEHIGHSIRIHRAQLTCDFFPCPTDLKDYIYSLDYEQEGFFMNHSSIGHDEKIRLTQINQEKWKKSDQEIFIPLSKYQKT